MGKLHFGDNLQVLRKHIKDESIDLIYMDPPFNSDADYNLLFRTSDDVPPAAQIMAFEDTWHWTDESESSYNDILNVGGGVAAAIVGMRQALGTGDVLAYLVMMTVRIIELRRVLKPTGSLYLHCDPTASHYLKMVLDMVFGPENFRNEIVWYKGFRGTRRKTLYQREHDIIFYYTVSDKYTWNAVYGEYRDKDMKRYNKTDDKGEKYALIKRKRADGSTYYGKTYPRGKLQGDVIDVPTLSATSHERTGYPTQKPQALLEKIILASSNKGDTVMDPFCGCGTAVHAAQKLGRKWIGVDVTHLAVNLVEKRLHEAFGTRPDVCGTPTSIEDAAELARRDKFQFETWAATLVPSVVPNKKRAGDRGVDGIGFIRVGRGGGKRNVEAKIIVSVKGGENLNPGMVRDLAGTVNSENADMGVLVCLREPTRAMSRAAAASGSYRTPVGTSHPRIQIHTVRDHFDRRALNLPLLADVAVGGRDRTEAAGVQRSLDDDGDRDGDECG